MVLITQIYNTLRDFGPFIKKIVQIFINNLTTIVSRFNFWFNRHSHRDVHYIVFMFLLWISFSVINFNMSTFIYLRKGLAMYSFISTIWNAIILLVGLPFIVNSKLFLWLFCLVGDIIWFWSSRTVVWFSLLYLMGIHIQMLCFMELHWGVSVGI